MKKRLRRFQEMPLKNMGGAIALGLMLAACGGPTAGRLMFPAYRDGGNSRLNNSRLNSRFSEQSPQVSGRYLAFVSDRRGSQALYLFDLRDRRLIPLPGLNRLDSRFDGGVGHPAVSENGNWIVFAASREGRSGIFLYRRNSQQVRNLVPSLRGEMRNPTISAAGDRIAFEISRNGQWDIAIYDRQGRPLGIPTNPR